MFELGASGYEKDLSHKRALLHYAVIYQRHKVLEYLLQLKYENTPACTNYKLYINAVDSQGMTPLDYALEHRDTYAIELLYRYRKETIDPDAGKGWGEKHVQKIIRDNTPSDTMITVEAPLDISWERLKAPAFLTLQERITRAWKKTQYKQCLLQAGQNTALLACSPCVLYPRRTLATAISSVCIGGGVNLAMHGNIGSVGLLIVGIGLWPWICCPDITAKYAPTCTCDCDGDD